MSALFTAWYDYVFPHVPGATTALVLQAIKEATVSFCERSLAYRHTPSAINIVGLTSTYTISPPADTVVHDFTHVVVNGADIDGQSDDWLDANVDDWRTTASGPARAWRSPDTNQIQLVPTPSESITGGLVVECAIKPLLTATSVPDWMFNDYRTGIRDGALAYLYQMPRKPWTSADLYRHHQAEFHSWCELAALRAEKGRTNLPLRTSLSF